MRRLCGPTVGLVLGLATALLLAEAPKQGRELTAEEQKEMARLHAEADRHALADRFEDAVKVLKRVADYRTQRQGANSWQVIDARLRTERWRRLTGVAAKNRAEVVRGLLAAAAGSQLQQRLRYREAEAKLRESLAICVKVLGERPTPPPPSATTTWPAAWTARASMPRLCLCTARPWTSGSRCWASSTPTPPAVTTT